MTEGFVFVEGVLVPVMLAVVEEDDDDDESSNGVVEDKPAA